MQQPDNIMTEIENSALPPLEMAQLRQALYRFLGMLFLYPDQTRLGNIKIAAGELLTAKHVWETLDFSPQLHKLLTSLLYLNEETFEQIEEEYNHLIRVKPAAPPYESFYLDPQGQIRAVIATELETEYTNSGLALSSSLQDMPDHVSVELEFMSFLCAGEVKAIETANEDDDNMQIRIQQRAFLNKHLVRWFPQFAQRITDAAPESLYSVITATAYAFLRSDLSYLGLRKS